MSQICPVCRRSTRQERVICVVVWCPDIPLAQTILPAECYPLCLADGCPAVPTFVQAAVESSQKTRTVIGWTRALVIFQSGCWISITAAPEPAKYRC